MQVDFLYIYFKIRFETRYMDIIHGEILYVVLKRYFYSLVVFWVILLISYFSHCLCHSLDIVTVTSESKRITKAS